MTYYNADTSDLFLFALGNFFDINIVIFKSNERECWAEDLMKNDGCNRKTVYFVQTQTLSQHIDLVAPIRTQDTSSDDSVEITKVLQETEGDDEAQEVKRHCSCIDSRKADKEDDSGIKCKLFSCIFSQVRNYFLGFIFIVKTGGNQHSFCHVQIKHFGSSMTENCFKICRKCNDKFF